MRRTTSPMTGYYESYLYEFGESVETCGHRHPTLASAWKCAETFDPADPFDVVWVTDDVVEWTCRRREDDELA